jgi:Farnesoic acid 0-methyl transferase
VYTTPDRGYVTLHRSLLDNQQTLFKVRATSDARIALLSVPSNFRAPSYEITVGARQNTVTTLRCRSPSGDIVFNVDSPDILSARELRTFWIRWMNGTFEFGKGEVIGVTRVLMYEDPDPTYSKHVLSLAVSSLVNETTEWEFGNPFDTSKIVIEFSLKYPSVCC